MPPLKRKSLKKPLPTPLRRWRFLRILKVTLFLLITGLVVGAGFWGFNHGSNWIHHTLYRIGFQVEDVWIEGRQKTSLNLLRQTVGLKRGDDIFRDNPEAIKERLEALPWVCAAVVSRQLPRALHIYIAERQPLALWQRNNKHVLVDTMGEVIPCPPEDYPPALLKIVGDRAPQETQFLLKVLQQFPALYKRVMTAVHLRSGRWDLHLRDNCVLRLPPMNPKKIPSLAIQRFLRLEKKNKGLTETYARIDLRFANRMILCPHKPLSKSQRASSKRAQT